MSDPTLPADAVLSSTARYDRSPRRAFAELTEAARNEWHLRYCAQEGAEPRVWVLLDKVEREMRAAGEPTTIHSLWIKLADRAGQEASLDVSAAAALAGFAIGLGKMS